MAGFTSGCASGEWSLRTLLRAGIAPAAGRLRLQGARGAAGDAGRFTAAEVADQRLSVAGVAGDGIKGAGAKTRTTSCAASLIKKDSAESWIPAERTLGTGGYTGWFGAEPANERLVKSFGLLLKDPDP